MGTPKTITVEIRKEILKFSNDVDEPHFKWTVRCLDTDGLHESRYGGLERPLEVSKYLSNCEDQIWISESR